MVAFRRLLPFSYILEVLGVVLPYHYDYNYNYNYNIYYR
jgi:hypothetical protein